MVISVAAETAKGWAATRTLHPKPNENGPPVDRPERGVEGEGVCVCVCVCVVGGMGKGRGTTAGRLTGVPALLDQPLGLAAVGQLAGCRAVERPLGRDLLKPTI